MRLAVVTGLVLALGAALGPAPAEASEPDALGPSDVVRDVTLPTGATSVGTVMRDGERVVAVLRVDGVRRVLQDDLSDDAGWQPVPGEAATSSAELVFVEAASHGATVFRRRLSGGVFDELVTGPAGVWSVPQSRVSLDAAGGYVLVQDGPERGVYTTDHVRVADLGSPESQYAVDGGALWTLDGLQISRTDLGRPGAVPVAVTTAPWCFLPPDHFKVRGRWAAMTCGDYSGPLDVRVVDVQNKLREVVVPAPEDQPEAELADGAFAAGSTTSVVKETGAGSPERQIAVAWETMRANGSGPGFAYLDPARAIHLFDPALAGVADADVTPPTVSTTAVPAVVAPGPLSLSWSATDPPGSEGPAAGIWSYEVNRGSEEGVSPHSTVRLSPVQTTWTTTLDAGLQHVCFRVRATDRRANVGEWSPPTCTTIDAYPPEVAPVSYPITLRHASGTDAYVDYRFQRLRGADDPATLLETRLRRSTQSSTSWSDWSTPYSSATPLRTKTLHAGQRICFQGRGIDEVGNVSAWLPASCTAAPYDDSLARRSGSTSVFRSVAAFGGSARRLTGSGSLSVSSYSSANCVSVRAIGGGINAVGTLDVSIGGRHVGTITPYYDTRTWGNFYDDTGRSLCGKGTVTVRHHAGSAPVTVDWIALTRPGDDGYEYGAR